MQQPVSHHTVRKLTYACDSDGALRYIDEVPNGNACGCVCPACGKPLMARNRGEMRIHHFAHQTGAECEYAYETMLHLLAKEKVRDAFLCHDSFIMEYEYRSYCSKKKECHCWSQGDCFTKLRRNFNLKDFYDSCEQEVAYDTSRRRSDLKIYSASNPTRRPIYIEFCVTHPSDYEKLHSGDKIIEIMLESEEDVDKLVQNGFVESELQQEQTPLPVAFYGFDKKEDYNNNSVDQEIEIVRYVLYPSGKTLCRSELASCRNLSRYPNSLMEIVFHTPVAYDLYEYAKYVGYFMHKIPNCMVCKNYIKGWDDQLFCKLYKHLNLAPFAKHDTARAKTCPYFKVDQNEMRDRLEQGCNYPFDIL